MSSSKIADDFKRPMSPPSLSYNAFIVSNIILQRAAPEVYPEHAAALHMGATRKTSSVFRPQLPIS